MQFLNVLLILTMISAASTVDPGFQAAVTQKGINYLLKIGVPLLKEEIKTVNIPDMSKYYFDIYGIVLSRIDLGELSLPLSNDGLSLSSFGVSLSGSGNWKYKFLFIHGHGNVDMKVDDTSLTIRILVEMGDKGEPTLLINECNVDFDKLNIDFYGDLSLLSNLLEKINFIKDEIKKHIRKKICKKITNFVQNKATAMLGSFSIEIPIPNTAAKINYALVSNPIFTPEYMLSQHKGEFEYFHHSKEAPFKPSPLPMPKILDKMIYIWLSPYTINTAAYVYEQAGLLQIHANSSIVPPDSPFQITTELFSEIIPEFYHKYPDMKFTIRVYSTTSPYLKVSPNEIHLDVNGNLEVGVKDGNNISSPAFNLTLSSKLSGDVTTIEKDGMPFITGELLNIENNVSLKDSAFGQFNTSRFTYAADLFTIHFLIPGINKFLANGIQIPMIKGVHFIEPEIIFGDDYILISTDVEYHFNTPGQSGKSKRS